MMTNLHTTPPNSVSSSRRLMRSTAIAAATALVLLVTAVLPAEYGIDPTGLGRVIGLTQMGEIKMSLAREAVAADSAEAAALASGAQPSSAAVPGVPTPQPPAKTGDADSPSAIADSASNARVTEVSLDPGQGKELKLVMTKGSQANYSWSTDSGVVNYDIHGDARNVPNSYHNYKKGSGAASDQGILIAAFDGNHGWFWRNRARGTITITLRTSGEYTNIVLPR